MDAENKRKFDALVSIRDHAWREFEDKARAEWRLSFGIWAAVLASAGAVIAANPKPTVNENLLLGVLVLIGTLHAIFLLWIQRKLDSARRILHEAQWKMRELLELPTDPYTRSKWRQAPLWIELAITILVAVILFEVVNA